MPVKTKRKVRKKPPTWGTSKTIHTEVGELFFVSIKCEDCTWQRELSSYEADRMAARRHAEAEGHNVSAELERTIIWRAK